MNKQLMDLLNRVDIVSFDLYDTLIYRHVLKPSDVFDLVEKKFNNSQKDIQIFDFKKRRLEAEKKCRKNSKFYEVTLDEIYNELADYYNFDVLPLEKIEKEIEICIADKKKEGSNIYDWCVQHNKKIIITTDMYLDENTINKILKRFNYIYYNLYLSSKYKLRKKNGTLYNQILSDLNIEGNKILHIGDNYVSDIQEANKKGINTWYIKNQRKKIKLFARKKGQSMVVANYLHNYNEDNYFSTLGQYVLGPLLYGYSVWLNKFIISKKPDKVVFLARDGAIMKKAYETLYGKSQKLIYAYASRRSLIVPILWKNCSINYIQNAMHFHDRMSLLEIIERIGIQPEQIKNEMEECGLDENYILNGLDLENDQLFVKLFSKIKNKIYENSKKEYENSIKYWRKILENSESVFIVDIGWNGNMQNALQKLLNYEIGTNIKLEGFYLGVNPNTKYDFPMYGFIYDKTHNQDLKEVFDHFLGVCETFFMTNHGSVHKYIDNKTGVELYPNEYENHFNMKINELEAIDGIQKSAIQFVDKFKNFVDKTEITFNDNEAYINMIELGLHPSLESTKKLGDFRFFNSKYSYLARKSKKFNFNELINTNWRIGYMKRYLKINIRYDFLAKMIKKAKKIMK